MWGTSIIGFGSHHYKYDSGREGDSPNVSFSPRASSIALYLSGSFQDREELLKKFGRLIPGVLNDETSALTDSFQDNLLAPPVYTRPEDFRGNTVPPILLSGDSKKIEDWRYEQSLERTEQRRPDLLGE